MQCTAKDVAVSLKSTRPVTDGVAVHFTLIIHCFLFDLLKLLVHFIRCSILLRRRRSSLFVRNKHFCKIRRALNAKTFMPLMPLEPNLLDNERIKY